MEEYKTDSVSDYIKHPIPDLESTKNSENNGTVGLLNGCDGLEDLDLMALSGEPCENASFETNSDVWRDSDTEEDISNKNMSDTLSKDFEDAIEDVGETTVDDLNTKESSKLGEGECSKTMNLVKFLDSNSSGQQADDDINNEQTSANSDRTLEEIESILDPDLEMNSSNQNAGESVNKEDGSKSKLPEVNTEPTCSNEKEDNDIARNNATPEAEHDPLSVDHSEEDPLADNQQLTKSPGNGESSVADVSVDITDFDESGSDKDPLAVVIADDETPVISTVDKDNGPNRNNPQDGDDGQVDYDAEDDDDFDPSLLCPELSMEVDENIISSNEGNSNATYEPMNTKFMDEVTGVEIIWNLTAEEQELKKTLYGTGNSIRNSRLHCTACNIHLGSALEAQTERYVHPLLKVLICKTCYKFYTSGDFEKDEDGSELYCRWCGQGGQVLCCSKCEFVFKCIRFNFGRKKMFAIRDSDSWDCFRCNMAQIMTHRVACFEFFEYVHNERQRAATIKNSDIWSNDYSRCCSNKKRPAEDGPLGMQEQGPEMKKIKRKKSCSDPDFNPLLELNIQSSSSIQKQSSNISYAVPLQNQTNTNRPSVNVLPRIVNRQKDNDIEFVRSIPPPRIQVNPSLGSVNNVKVINNRPSNQVGNQRQIYYRATVQPGGVLRFPGQMPSLVSTGGQRFVNPMHNRINPSALPQAIKHEWFEKTVRAAARVNSHLSYTLTQLNKAQSQAGSIEELAVVHNKLQEILSSSINSLIQIRKNLRTEFITGIKTVRLPSRKPEMLPPPIVDDDVIFVSSPNIPLPPPLSVCTPRNDFGAGGSSIGRSVPQDPLSLSNFTPTSALNSTNTNSDKPAKGYLKVKSFLDLQNVPSECITIPDDVATTSGLNNGTDADETPAAETCNSPKRTLVIKKSLEPVILKEKSTAVLDVSIQDDEAPDKHNEQSLPKPKEQDSPKSQDRYSPKSQDQDSPKSQDQDSPKSQDQVSSLSKNESGSMVYNTKNLSSPETKRMLSVTVKLEKVDLAQLKKKLEI